MSIAPNNEPIIGYDKIAAAVTKALKQSVSERTARRWARQGRTHRLPVMIYPNGRAYLLPADLELFARSWTAPRPSGARAPGEQAGPHVAAAGRVGAKIPVQTSET